MSRFWCWFIPAFSAGAIVGVLVTRAWLVEPDQTWIPSLLTSLTAIGLGAYVNGALRRKSVIDRVPISYVAASNKAINDLLLECVKAPGKKIERLAALRHLSNEIDWLLDVTRLAQPVPSSLSDDLLWAYVALKGHLTWSDRQSPIVMLRMTRAIRKKALKVELCFTKQMLERGFRGDVCS